MSWQGWLVLDFTTYLYHQPSRRMFRNFFMFSIFPPFPRTDGYYLCNNIYIKMGKDRVKRKKCVAQAQLKSQLGLSRNVWLFVCLCDSQVHPVINYKCVLWYVISWSLQRRERKRNRVKEGSGREINIFSRLQRRPQPYCQEQNQKPRLPTNSSFPKLLYIFQPEKKLDKQPEKNLYLCLRFHASSQWMNERMSEWTRIQRLSGKLGFYIFFSGVHNPVTKERCWWWWYGWCLVLSKWRANAAKVIMFVTPCSCINI